MRDLSSHVAESDAAIEGNCAQPVRLAQVPLRGHAPKPHMMTLASIVTYRLFKGKVLPPAEKKQVADRRLVVGAMKDRALHDAHAALQGDRICRIPTGSQHRCQ